MLHFTDLGRIVSKILLFLLVFSVFGCTTQRKKGDTSKLGKMYHNTTAKYNGYFNANELVEETMLTLKDMHESNYSSILPVYDYVAVDNPTSVSDNLDKAIEKVITVTALHEQSHWVDDCYILMGKAQYLKHDFESAQETLEYFEEQFDPKNPYGRNYTKAKNTSKSKKDRKKEQKEREEVKKDRDKVKKEEKKEREKSRKEEQKDREKERKDRLKSRKKGKRESSRASKDIPKAAENVKLESPTPKKTETKIKKTDEAKLDDKKEEKKDDSYDGGMFKHRPAYYEGMLWLSRTYIERERYQAANRILDEIAKAPSLSKETQRELPAAYAHLHISQENYQEALYALEEAIHEEKDRSVKARYNFIYAQINAESGHIQKANEAYDKCIKLSQQYEMAFNAEINKIKLAHASGRSDTEGSLKKLNKMLNEDKNIGFEGQIFYTRAEIFLEEGDISEAQKEFQMALSSGGNSTTIQVESYYKLANIFYDKERYVESKNYYDSTMAVMPKTDRRILEVQRFSSNLDAIVENIEIIERQDSLLRLSKMSKEEIKEIAKELLKNSRELVNEAREESKGKNININTRPSRVLSGGRSTFFAYNPISKNQGFTTFRRIYGQRALEDNWRRSQRNDANSLEGDIVEEELVEEEKEISEADLARVMKEIPSSPEEKLLAKEKIMEAMMELGVLYRDRLQNYEKSADILKQLTNRFPQYEKTDQALYYLYLSYQELDEKAKATKVLNKLSTIYPKSSFTKLALDPAYAKQLIKDQNQELNFYNETYEIFNKHEHAKVIDRANEAAKIFDEESEYLPKFALLKAMSVGNIKGEKDYIKELNLVSKQYPNTPESIRAKEILRFLQGDVDAFDDVLYNEASELFEKAPDQLHYALVVLYELPKKRLDQVKINVSDFNKKFHRLQSLKISNITLNRDNKSQIVMIRGFESEAKAMAYYDSATKNSKEFVKGKINFDFFISTQKNFRELIKQRTVSAYRVFFDANYINN